MLENIVRHIEDGEQPFEAALKGSREIGFTIVSMTLSLVAVFIPVLFMGGVVGRMFNEFARGRSRMAILISGFVSLTLTPMLCSRLLQAASTSTSSTISCCAPSRRASTRVTDRLRLGAAAVTVGSRAHAARHARHLRRSPAVLFSTSPRASSRRGHRPALGLDRRARRRLVRRHGRRARACVAEIIKRDPDVALA